MFDAAQPLFKRIVNILTQPSAIGKILDVHFEYQLESDHDRGMMSITLNHSTGLFFYFEADNI
jgi:hypothetical protein